MTRTGTRIRGPRIAAAAILTLFVASGAWGQYDPLQHGLSAGGGNNASGRYDPLQHGLSAGGPDEQPRHSPGSEAVENEIVGQVLNAFGIKTLAQREEDRQRSRTAIDQAIARFENPFLIKETDDEAQKVFSSMEYAERKRLVSSPDFVARGKLRNDLVEGARQLEGHTKLPPVLVQLLYGDEAGRRALEEFREESEKAVAKERAETEAELKKMDKKLRREGKRAEAANTRAAQRMQILNSLIAAARFKKTDGVRMTLKQMVDFADAVIDGKDLTPWDDFVELGATRGTAVDSKQHPTLNLGDTRVGSGICDSARRRCTQTCSMTTQLAATVGLDSRHLSAENTDFPENCRSACALGASDCAVGKDDRCDDFQSACDVRCPSTVFDWERVEYALMTDAEEQCRGACRKGKSACEIAQ